MRILVFILFSFVVYIGSAQKVYLKSISKADNSPVGDMKSVKTLIFNEMYYPIEDIKSQTDGTVAIQYQLTSSGVPKNVKVILATSATLEKEAMRLFKKIEFPEKKNRVYIESRYEVMTFNFSRKDWVKVYTKRGYKEIMYPHEPIDSTEKTYFYKELKEDKPYALFSKKEHYKSYMDFISAKMEFPEEALRLNLKGEVVVSFIVEQSGRISNVNVVQPLGAGCTQEALRLINMITWYPGRKDGKAVRTKMISSIGFGVNSIPFYGSFNASGGGN
ncbi:MAG: energy transducer TonB [Flavobacteriales bacterium]|nr:energy transducer TonB [Flavobacteriales bacterium]